MDGGLNEESSALGSEAWIQCPHLPAHHCEGSLPGEEC